MHVDAEAAAVDLAGAQVDEIQGARGHAAILGRGPQSEQRLQGIRNDHYWTLHSRLIGCHWVSPCLHWITGKPIGRGFLGLILRNAGTP